MDSSHPPYRIERWPKALAEMLAAFQEASRRGMAREYVAAWKKAVLKLETTPHSWGDPVYNTRKEGGIVRRGIQKPIVVEYAVYEIEHVVCLIGVRLLPEGD